MLGVPAGADPTKEARWSGAQVRRRSVKGRHRSGLAQVAAAAAVSCAILTIGAGASQVDAQTFTVLHYFTGVEGSNPYASLVEASDGALYGTAVTGGAADLGVVFKINKDGTDYASLHNFNGVGIFPKGALADGSDGALYGTTEQGGAYGNGIIFVVNKDGTGFRALHDFHYGDPEDGAQPSAGVVEGSDGTLYGTTYIGGVYGYGVVFKIKRMARDT